MRKVLLLIVLLSAFFRVYDLGTLPSWYWDEGVNLNIASNLMHGRLQMFSLTYPFVPHPPLFFLVVMSLFKVWGVSILAIRNVTAACGILTTIMLYFAGREIFDERIALASSFLYAVFPAAIYWSRMGLANNLLVLLSVVSFFFMGRYMRKSQKFDLYMALTTAGLSFVTEYAGIATIFAIAYLLFRHERRVFPVIISFIPFSFFAVAMLAIMPGAFLSDFLFLIKRHLLPLGLALVTIALLFVVRVRIKQFYNTLISDLMYDKVAAYYLIIALWSVRYLPSVGMFHKGTTYFVTLGLAAMFLILGLLKDPQRSLIASFFVFHFLMLFALNRADHMLMLIYPYLMLAISLIMFRSLEDILSFLKKMRVPRLYKPVIAFIVFLPFWIGLFQATSLFVLGNGIPAQDIPATFAIIDYINDNAEPDDLVITYSYLGHLINARTCPIIQSIASGGVQVEYYRGDLGPERSAFECSYEDARLITLTDSLMESLGDRDDYSGFMNHLETMTYERIGDQMVYTGSI